MRTTLILRDDLVKQAMELTGITEKTALVHAGLKALLEQAARERLIAIGGAGSKTSATQPKRRRSA